MSLPRLNTLEKDIEDFQAERKKFLDNQERFKLGLVEFGISALNFLSSMYHILLASYHYPKTETTIKPTDYMAEINTLKVDIVDFVNRKSDSAVNGSYYKVPGFKELEARFDETVRKFYIIKAECGLT